MAMASPRVHTYHCTFCSHLLLASTHDFAALPRRKPPGLDKAIIVPLPPPPKADADSPSSSEDEPEPDDEPNSSALTGPDAPLVEDNSATKGGAGGVPPPRRPARRKRDKDSYTVLLTLARDRAAKVITREDGFEKRWVWRCGRCRLVVGYQLDEMHYELGPRSDTHPNTAAVGGGEAGAGKDRAEKERRRMERGRGLFLYVLPGAVVQSEELGREIRREEVELGGGD